MKSLLLGPLSEEDSWKYILNKTEIPGVNKEIKQKSQ